jgi:hypothetical protein
VRLNAKQEKKYRARLAPGAATSGLSSTLAFTPVQVRIVLFFFWAWAILLLSVLCFSRSGLSSMLALTPVQMRCCVLVLFVLCASVEFCDVSFSVFDFVLCAVAVV